MSEIIISSGVTSTGLVAESGDIITVEAGGALVNGTVNAGATLNATQDAILENLTAVAGATVELTGTAKTSGAILKGANTNIAEGKPSFSGWTPARNLISHRQHSFRRSARICPLEGGFYSEKKKTIQKNPAEAGKISDQCLIQFGFY